MKLPQIPLALLACALLAPAGCKSPNPPAPTPRTSEPDTSTAAAQSVSRTRRSRPAANAQPGDFDFYLLNLSWSPEFCTTHPSSPECRARPGFIVHGLWPQNTDGTFPENCGGMPKVPNAAAYLDIMPTITLIQHEWQTHGTCTGLNPDAYFADIRQAFRSLEIPSMFAPTETPPRSIQPEALLAQFRHANPSFPPTSFALSCGNNFLTAVEVCFDKNFTPQACEGVRSCRANVIKIAPREP